MALFTTDQLRNRVANDISKGYTRTFSEGTTLQKAENILNESFNFQRLTTTTKTWDIFLSHSSNDKTLVAGLKLELEDLGYSVYIDWIDDPKLDRRYVTKATAQALQDRMKNCKSLFYAFTENSHESRWMPWELGYFDGIKQKAAVLPISTSIKSEYRGTEYLGIYYYITKENMSSGQEALWVNESLTSYCLYNTWVSNQEKPYKRK